MSLQQSSSVGTQQTIGQLSYRAIQDLLTEKDWRKDIVRPCVIDAPRCPTADCQSIIHVGNPYVDNSPIISLPSRVSPQEAEQILKGVVPVKEFCLMLEHLASAYQSHRMAIIEGETSIGKTLAVSTFTKLLYGERVVPLDFYCVGQTDVSELMGKWVPDTTASDPLAMLEQLAQDPRMSELASQLGSNEERLSELASIAALMNGAGKQQWKFQLGAVPKALAGTIDIAGKFILPEEPGSGFILHVQEIGLARPAVVDALLKLRGDRAQLARSVQIWEDGGRVVPTGDSTFVVMTTNPPETYLERNELDVALVRASEFLRLEHLSNDSLSMIARRVFSGALSEPFSRNPVWGTDLREANELGDEVASFLALFHEKALVALKGGEAGRAQRILPTTDDFDRVRSRVLYEQVLVEGSTGILEVDIVATLERAIDKTYLARLTDIKKNELKTTMAELLNKDIGKIEFRGISTARAEVLSTLCREFIEERRSSAPSLLETLEAEQMGTEAAGLVARIRDRWQHLAEKGYLQKLPN